jgi:hypothetical protein
MIKELIWAVSIFYNNNKVSQVNILAGWCLANKTCIRFFLSPILRGFPLWMGQDAVMCFTYQRTALLGVIQTGLRIMSMVSTALYEHSVVVFLSFYVNMQKM